jgi:hypothetical protein
MTLKNWSSATVTVIRNPDRYLAKAVTNYRDDCVSGFTDDGEAKRALWQVAVNVYEIANEADAERWIDQLRRIAADHLKPGQIDSTVRSAARKAGGRD